MGLSNGLNFLVPSEEYSTEMIQNQIVKTRNQGLILTLSPMPQ